MGATKSWLEELESLSRKRGDGGLIHSGIIHYCQSRSIEDGFDGGILKIVIYAILEAVPEVFPRNLPALMADAQKEGRELEATEAQKKWLNRLSDRLPLPLTGSDVCAIIRFASDYEAMCDAQQ